MILALIFINADEAYIEYKNKKIPEPEPQPPVSECTITEEGVEECEEGYYDQILPTKINIPLASHTKQIVFICNVSLLLCPLIMCLYSKIIFEFNIMSKDENA